MTGLLRSCLIGLLALAGASCSVDVFTYTVDRYGSVKSTHVRLACRDTYEVYDRPEAGSLMVITNPLTEIVACEAGPVLPLPERQRQVAEIFLFEKTDRPDCRIVRSTGLTGRHREFDYVCPAPRPARERTTARR